jgi:hypothetical protein
MDLYYRRSFAEAALRFRKTLALLPGDFNADNLCKRCEAYARTPSPPGVGRSRGDAQQIVLSMDRTGIMTAFKLWITEPKGG